jgi:TolB protein
MMSKMYRFILLTFCVVLTTSAAIAQRGKLVYAEDTETGSAIHIFDLSTGSDEILLENAYLNLHPVLSPDAQTIAFTSNLDSNLDGDLDLFLLDVSTRNITQLTDSTESEMDPSWSSDSIRIVYAFIGETSSQIRIYDTQTDTATTLIDDGQFNFHPNWSPDGQKLSYVSHRGTFLPLFVYDFNTSTSVLVTPLNTDVVAPRWSPDGQKIVYRGTGHQLYVITLATLQTQVVTSDLEAGNHLWQASDLLFYVVPFDAAYIIKSDGTGKQQVSVSLPTTDAEFGYPFNVELVTITPTYTPTITPTPWSP